MTHHLELSPYEVELVSLLAEKAIAEKKALSHSELNEKIDSIKKTLKQQYEENEEPLQAIFHLSVCDLENFR